jgi:hypothetical protein
MQCVCGFAAAFGCRHPAKSRSVQINMFIRTVGRFCRYNTLKNYTDAAMQSLSRIVLERHRQNFARTKILPEERTRIKNIIWGRF